MKKVKSLNYCPVFLIIPFLVNRFRRLCSGKHLPNLSDIYSQSGFSLRLTLTPCSTKALFLLKANILTARLKSTKCQILRKKSRRRVTEAHGEEPAHNETSTEGPIAEV